MKVDTDYPTRELLKGLASLALFIRDYKDSHSKAYVFNAIMGLVCEIPPFRQKVQDMEFFYPPLCLMPLKSGMVAYTLKNDQINVHFAVPVFPQAMFNLISEMTETLSTPMFDSFAVNMRPLRISTPDVCEVCLKKRRIIPRAARDIELVDDRYIRYKEVVLEIERIVNSQDILYFVPLTRSCFEQPDDTQYWTKTNCGKIVVFQNPTVDIIEGMGLPPLNLDLDSIYTCFPAALHGFIKAIYPQTIEATLDALKDEKLPSYIKPVLIRTCKAIFGIRDELILQVGVLMERQEILPTALHIEMLHMTQLVKMSYAKNANGHTIALGVLALMRSCDDAVRWRTWAIHSRFIYYLFDLCSIDTIRRMCIELPVCRVALSKMLRVRIGNWSWKERQGANLLQSLPEADVNEEEEKAVFEEMKRLEREADVTLKDILEQERSKESISEPRKRHSKKQETVSLPDAEGLEISTETATRTHHAVVQQLSMRWPQFEWFLIGSGIFSNESDVDVVVVVPFDAEMTLQEAYTRVQTATTFDRRGSVDGTHLCTLCSRWNGYPVDVQVMREAGDTVSENLTINALNLARRLEAESDETIRENVITLHRWFTSTALKGHTRCHLPGVAVTCIAVYLTSRRRVASIAFTLEMLRDAVFRDVVSIDFDNWDVELDTNTSLQRPHAPLSVIVNEKNVASRLTTAWTRHLLDTLTFSMTLTPERVFVKDVYVAWRRQSMVYCATLRPKEACSVALTLFQSLSKLEGHPLIESYHAGDDGDLQTDVVIRCTLNGDASSKYRFQPKDSFALFDGYIMVTSGTRQVRLNTSDGRGEAFNSSLARRLPCSFMFDAERRQRFPNAPYLTADTIAAFSPNHWTVV